jgi:hypothetical protein
MTLTETAPTPEIIALAEKLFDARCFPDRTTEPRYVALTCLRMAAEFYTIIDRARAGESLEAIEASL